MGNSGWRVDWKGDERIILLGCTFYICRVEFSWGQRKLPKVWHAELVFSHPGFQPDVELDSRGTGGLLGLRAQEGGKLRPRGWWRCKPARQFSSFSFGYNTHLTDLVVTVKFPSLTVHLCSSPSSSYSSSLPVVFPNICLKSPSYMWNSTSSERSLFNKRHFLLD